MAFTPPALPKFNILARLAYFVVGIQSALVILPFLWMLVSSFKTTKEIFVRPLELPDIWQWSNYARAWEGGVATYLLNSLIVTVLSVILITLVSALAAYALARIQFKGRLAFYALVLAGYAVPIHALMVPLYGLLNETATLNTYTGLILPYVAFQVPFGIIVLYAFFLEFPRELEEAARLDGCGLWQRLFLVVLPLSTPGLASVAIFSGVFVWNEFILALIIMTNDSLKTLPPGLAGFQDQFSVDWGAMMAGVIIAILPILLVFVALQRQFTRSLAGLGK